MVKYFYTILLLLCLAMSSSYAENSKFIDGLEDIPLMSGLIQQSNETISFGNEESRFVEVSLISTKFGFKKIEKFYKESLPQLGWNYQGTADDSVIFYRDTETLSIHKENTKPLKIRITVKNRT